MTDFHKVVFSVNILSLLVVLYYYYGVVQREKFLIEYLDEDNNCGTITNTNTITITRRPPFYPALSSTTLTYANCYKPPTITYWHYPTRRRYLYCSTWSYLQCLWPRRGSEFKVWLCSEPTAICSSVWCTSQSIHLIAGCSKICDPQPSHHDANDDQSWYVCENTVGYSPPAFTHTYMHTYIHTCHLQVYYLTMACCHLTFIN